MIPLPRHFRRGDGVSHLTFGRFPDIIPPEYGAATG